MGVLIGSRQVNQVQGKSLAARSYGARCLDVAQRKGDRIFSVQANANLAHTLCIMVYGWFTEGFDTLDLKQAKALLDELTA